MLHYSNESYIQDRATILLIHESSEDSLSFPMMEIELTDWVQHPKVTRSRVTIKVW